MKEDFIKFETAKLAKEKGFNFTTRYYYDFIGDVGSTSSTDENWNQSKESIYSRPTQSLLQKFLRDNHRIHIEIPHYSDCPTKYFNDENYNDELGSYGIRIHEPNTQSQKDIFVSNINYETYEEALEFALQEALKLI